MDGKYPSLNVSQLKIHRKMITLSAFKQELGVEKLEFLKGKGRAFTNVGRKCIVIGKTTDLKKPLYVIEMTTNADGVAIAPETAYVIVNNDKVKADVVL